MREESDTADGHRSNDGGGNGSIGEAQLTGGIEKVQRMGMGLE